MSLAYCCALKFWHRVHLAWGLRGSLYAREGVV